MMFLKSILVAACTAATISVFAQKPQWIGNTPKELNQTYKFVEVVSHGTSLDAARLDAKEQLTDNQQLIDGVRISRNTEQTTNIEKQRINGGKLQETQRDNIVVKLNVDGEEFYLQANKVDEYYTIAHGEYKLHTLYQVATCDNTTLDNAYLSTYYGAVPVFMSIIPGVGQWYKGSKGKGISMFAAEAAAVASILVCDNQRASYANKAIEQPKFAKEYTNKANNYETGRNISIGVAAGIWLYNIIDAAVAKGGRRVIVGPNQSKGFAMAPFVLPENGAGVSLAYSF